MRWAGHVARMGEGRNVHMVLVGKPEGKRPLGKPRRRWEDGIKMDLREPGCGGGGCAVGSPGSGQGLLAGCCERGDEPSGAGTTELVGSLVSASDLVSQVLLCSYGSYTEYIKWSRSHLTADPCN
jgi:hypothetical protein